MATTPLQTLTLDEKLQVSLNIQRTPYIQNADVIDWVQAKFKKLNLRSPLALVQFAESVTSLLHTSVVQTRLQLDIASTGDYTGHSHQDVDEDLARMMASMNADQSVAEYVGVDEDIDVHKPPE
ncbi:hypothetical protein L916_21581 [Phytophthora nicotianae]|uniref:Uncharacterized protein n=1 Tax=Phytophthora nicotianae TaxID=4792 RepID=W2HT65_PHYNI|nr:hypothetical protein L916_21581 [Phytophthora nicotianae]